jgi:hypothetical protein
LKHSLTTNQFINLLTVLEFIYWSHRHPPYYQRSKLNSATFERFIEKKQSIEKKKVLLHLKDTRHEEEK